MSCPAILSNMQKFTFLPEIRHAHFKPRTVSQDLKECTVQGMNCILLCIGQERAKMVDELLKDGLIKFSSIASQQMSVMFLITDHKAQKTHQLRLKNSLQSSLISYNAQPEACGRFTRKIRR